MVPSVQLSNVLLKNSASVILKIFFSKKLFRNVICWLGDRELEPRDYLLDYIFYCMPFKCKLQKASIFWKNMKYYVQQNIICL
jgi:hypothetical protein